MKVVAEESWVWMLFSDEDDALFLSVLCGSIGLYSIDFQLSEIETRNFTANDRSAIATLARDVSYQPTRYQQRHIADFAELPGMQEAVSRWRHQRDAES